MADPISKTPLELLDTNPNIANNPTTTNSPNTLLTTTINPFSSTDLDYAKALDEKMALDAIEKNKQVLSEDEYKAEALKSLQAEIDAQNSLYAGKLSRAKMEGVDRLGQEGAIQARRGLLGSDFGTASTNKVVTVNTDIQNSIENELALKLEEIRAGARKSGTEKYEAARRAKQEGLNAYITDLQNRGTLNATIADKIASDYFSKNIDPQADTNYLEQVAKEAGVSSSDIIKAYGRSVKAKEENDRKILKETTDINKTKAETENIAKKFEEDKRQFGLEYALKLRDQNLKETKQVATKGGNYKSELATQGRKAVANLLTIAQSNPGIFGGSAAAPIPDFLRSGAFRDYEAQLDFLKGNIIPAALAAMREASKTGGALGQVSDREGAWLGASLGALSMKQEPQTIINQLRQIDQSLSNWQTAVDKYGSDTPNDQPQQMELPDGTILNLQSDGTYQ